MSDIPQEHLGRYFFHFTHSDNMQSIVQNGLLSTNTKTQAKIEHVNIASESIQERRSIMEVTCGPKGVIHDYVPFYFCSVNPMFMSMLFSKNIDQQLIVILAIPINRILLEDAIFSDASANTKIAPNFYENARDLVKLNWKEIDSVKWSSSSETAKHQKMAEVLIHKKLDIQDIEYIIVWNTNSQNSLTTIFHEKKIPVPKFSFSPFKTKYKFHFTKFMFKDRELESLITGPNMLLHLFKHSIARIIEERKSSKTNYPFKDLADLLKNIKENFNVIPELMGIFELETKNEMHTNSVSEHTLEVVEETKKAKYFLEASKQDANILELSAYLHDIGKGPASKWSTGKQSSYPDHPVDSLSQLTRILIEDIEILTDYEIKMMCLLVAYHDLIGEIFGKGRNPSQLYNLVETEKEFDMLTTLNFADVSTLNFEWIWSYTNKINSLKQKVLETISEK